MKKILVVLLAMSLIGVFSGAAAAQVMGYSMDRAEKGFKPKPDAEPSAAVMAADVVLTRPVGLGLTLAGTGLYLVTLPFSIPAGSTDAAARAFIVKPGGYTFVRPFGRSAPQFEEQGIFGR